MATTAARSKRTRAAKNEALETLTGQVEDLFFPRGGDWGIATLHDKSRVTGELPKTIRIGDVVEFRGKYKDTERYGRQFAAQTAITALPKDTKGIHDYLSRHFKWVGPKMAKEMVAAFGENLFSIMEHHPEKLETISGITSARAQSIHDEYLAVKADREHDVFFAGHNISTNAVNRMLDVYKTKAEVVDVIRKNPFALADTVDGVGFKKADAIAASIGVMKDDEHRLVAGISYVLKESAQGEGHCYLTRKELLARSLELLLVGDATIPKVLEAVNRCIAMGAIVAEEDRYYLPEIYTAEKEVGERLRRMVERSYREAGERLQRMMEGNEGGIQIEESILNDGKFVMDPSQVEALKVALSNRVVVITGGPGTGKTFTVNKILQALPPSETVMLAAPTGKAAKRMSEMTGRQASTIHRLLEFNPMGGGFQINERNPLQCDTLVIDETSMLDINLMDSLLRGLRPECRVIFVGDVDQLPSVGPGNVLRDMIESGEIPTVRLKNIHRQGEKSFISMNAQAINHGKDITVCHEKGSDFWFLPEENAENIPGIIEKAIRRIPSEFDFAINDIQVLCPQKKGPIGTQAMNTVLRDVFNKDGEAIPMCGYRKYDRVIQTVNNYKLGVFNGEIGEVSGEGKDRDTVEVVFDSGGIEPRVIVYSKQALMDQTSLAYALSIHKYQGSETPCVIIPIHTTNYIMLTRGLIYTGITRGKKLVILVGMKKALGIAINTVNSASRNTTLCRLLQGGIEG